MTSAWSKFLYDLGYLPFDEPAKKLINQGMITGISKLIYHNNEHRIAISADVYNAWLEKEEGWESSTNTKDDLQKVDELISRGFTIDDFKSSQRALVDFVNKDDVLDVEKFKQWPVVRDEFSDFEFFMGSDNTFTCTPLIEKMSKSRYNVANPDEIYK
ncbi:MAG: hypothetical protein ACE5DN_03440, partial [Flavobacteriales bacterium]